ncbi:tail protein X [Helicobacter ganmani]|uniref:tail protein X n=1 Tax=Helicobacter ganmani TaxID=60246 RepID=UPI003A8529CF
MTDYQRYKELIKEIGDKKIQITALQNRIANVDLEPELNTEEVKELQRIYHRFMDEYPFFTYRQGASGTLETKTLLFYKGLSDNGVHTNKRIVIGKANNGSTYPTGRTTIARTYQNASGTSITTTPNLNPSGNISASTSFCGHFKGGANLAILRNAMISLPIGVLVTEQENTLDSTEAIRAAHYPRSLFEDLERVSYSPQDILDIQERIREEVRIRFNSEIAILTEQITALTEEKVEIEQNLDVLLTQSQAQLQEKQAALNNLEQTLENLEQNNATTLAEITALQEEIARLEAELERLNNENPQYTQNLQELESLRNQKDTLESQIANFLNNIALKEAELESARTEVATLISEVERKEQELQILQEQTTQKEQEREALQARKEELENALANIGDSDALDAEILSLQQQIAELEEQIAQNGNVELSTQKDALKAQRDNLLAQLEQQSQMQENLQTRIAELQEQITQLQEALEEINNEALQTQVTELETEITELTAILAQKEAQSQELQANITQKQQELESLQQLLASFEESEGELESLNAQIAEIQEELQKASQLQNAQSLLEDLQAKLQAAKDSNSLFAEELRQWHTNALKLAKQLGIELCRPLSNNVYPKVEEPAADFKGYVYLAKDNERLDSIVYSHYGTLEIFKEVLSCNPKLTNKPILEAGDKVYLPFLDTNIKTLEELWS